MYVKNETKIAADKKGCDQQSTADGYINQNIKYFD